MKYKVGDFVSLKIEVKNNSKSRILLPTDLVTSEVIEKYFAIISINYIDKYYMLLIDDDMIGWTINDWHIKYNDIDYKFLGKKFYEVNEQMIIRKQL